MIGTSMIAHLRHRWLMWWSPSYRLSVLGQAFADGLLRGLTDPNPEPISLESWKRIERIYRRSIFFLPDGAPDDNADDGHYGAETAE